MKKTFAKKAIALLVLIGALAMYSIIFNEGEPSGVVQYVGSFFRGGKMPDWMYGVFGLLPLSAMFAIWYLVRKPRETDDGSS